jgi:hypothetical protein
VYKENFGDDYYVFWVGGCRLVVVNSSLYTTLEEAAWDLLETEPRADKFDVCFARHNSLL